MLYDWPTLERVIAASRLILLYGPPGTGKTTAACKVGSPSAVSNVTLTDETAAAELRGHWMPGETWTWIDGSCFQRFRNGGRLVLNEIDKASDDALDFLHALLDDVGISSFTLPTGETVEPHETFCVVATMNGIPADLPDAVRDRFANSVLVDVPHPAALARFPQAVQDAIVGTTPVDDDDRRTSLRAWASYMDLAGKVGEEVAAQTVFGPRAGEVLSALKLAAER